MKPGAAFVVTSMFLIVVFAALGMLGTQTLLFSLGLGAYAAWSRTASGQASSARKQTLQAQRKAQQQLSKDVARGVFNGAMQVKIFDALTKPKSGFGGDDISKFGF